MDTVRRSNLEAAATLLAEPTLLEEASIDVAEIDEGPKTEDSSAESLPSGLRRYQRLKSLIHLKGEDFEWLKTDATLTAHYCEPIDSLSSPYIIVDATGAAVKVVQSAVKLLSPKDRQRIDKMFMSQVAAYHPKKNPRAANISKLEEQVGPRTIFKFGNEDLRGYFIALPPSEDYFNLGYNRPFDIEFTPRLLDIDRPVRPNFIERTGYIALDQTVKVDTILPVSDIYILIAKCSSNEKAKIMGLLSAASKNEKRARRKKGQR